MRITERAVKVDLHRDEQARIVVLAPIPCLDVEREECEPLLLVGEVGKPLRLRATPPLEVVEPIPDQFPILPLGEKFIAPLLELLVLLAKRLEFDQEWRS